MMEHLGASQLVGGRDLVTPPVMWIAALELKAVDVHIGIFTYGIERPDKLSGIARYTVELTRAMRVVAPEVEITLITPYPNSTLPWYQEFATYSVPSLKRLPAVFTAGHVVLHRAAATLALDVLHDPCGLAPFAVPGVRYKRAVTIHDSFGRVVPQTQDPLMRLLNWTLVPLARYTANAVFTVSEASARDLRRLYHFSDSALHVTPLGVTVHGPSPHPGDDLAALGVTGPYFLFVGNLTPRKNLGRVLDAFAQTQRMHPDLQLVVVGPAFWRSSEIFEHARHVPGVVLTGHVPDPVLDSLYRHAIGLVFPSLYEGFGLPALEAMARGCPVITSTISSLPEVAGDAALLVDPHQVDEIARAMGQLITEPGLRTSLQELGHARAAQFSWQHTARQTVATYHQLASR